MSFLKCVEVSDLSGRGMVGLGVRVFRFRFWLVLVCVLCVGSCVGTGGDGVRVSLNPMVLAMGLGRNARGDEVPVFGDDWAEHIPDSNDGLVAGYPRVEYKDLKYQQLVRVLQDGLQAALDEIEAELGIGPWDLVETEGFGCGPMVPSPSGNSLQFGSSPHVRMRASVEPTDEEYFQALSILERHYPGVNLPENQWRVNDTEAHRNYEVLSDNDSMLHVVHKEGSGGMPITLYGGCYVTSDKTEVISNYVGGSTRG